jgi:hypothetical protein
VNPPFNDGYVPFSYLQPIASSPKVHDKKKEGNKSTSPKGKVTVANSNRVATSSPPSSSSTIDKKQYLVNSGNSSSQKLSDLIPIRRISDPRIAQHLHDVAENILANK